MLANFYIILAQAKVIFKEGISIKKMSPPDWPMCKHVVHFLIDKWSGRTEITAVLLRLNWWYWVPCYFPARVPAPVFLSDGLLLGNAWWINLFPSNFVINTFINVFHVINYKLEIKFTTILKYLININLLNTLGLVK